MENDIMPLASDFKLDKVGQEFMKRFLIAVCKR